jgi:hypothetical protein
MIPHHVYDQLAILGCLWLCIMLHYGWPSRSTGSHQTSAKPIPLKCKRHRSTEPKPFEGLTHKPHCALCERETAHPQSPPPVPPHPMSSINRRPREVDTSRHFCPYRDCAYRGWVGWGNLRANGHPSGGPWRQLLCIVCRGYFLETLGTLFHGKRVALVLCQDKIIG